MRETRFTRLHAVALAVMAFSAIVLATWTLGSPKWFATLLFENISPDGRYRLQRWQAFYLSSQDYGFARLYDNTSGALMCESRVEWTHDNLQIDWPSAPYYKVSVGMDIHLALAADGRSCIQLPINRATTMPFPKPQRPPPASALVQ